MTKIIKPLLSAVFDPNLAVWPMLASTKLDGIRALVRDGVVLSRSLKPIPSTHVQSMFGHRQYEGLDGELIVGPANAPDCYLSTFSGVMGKDAKTNVRFHVFDDVENAEAPFVTRTIDLANRLARHDNHLLVYVQQHPVDSLKCALALYETWVDQGYEGMMLRSYGGAYKMGRSTVREGILLKHKPLMDSDAEVVSVYEQMHNGNEATVDELGHTKRSSHQENKVGKGTLGGFVARDTQTGVEFNVGIFVGVTDDTRKWMWDNRETLVGKTFKYTSLSIGVKDRPRHPRWTGWRDSVDISL